MNKDVTIGNTRAYHSYPDDGKRHPGLIVIEEIWGVNDHMKDVANRFAAEGFSVLSPELLPEGVLDVLTPQIQKDLFDPEKRHEVQPKLREAMAPIYQPEYAKATIATLKVCADYLLEDAGVDGTVSVLGFCFGGTYAFHLASHDARIKAAVPFYGQAPSEGEIPGIKAPILAFYGDQDANLMESLPKLKQDMEKEGKDFTAVVYPGAGHAFFNDTNPNAYKQDAAQDAWKKALAFLKK